MQPILQKEKEEEDAKKKEEEDAKLATKLAAKKKEDDELKEFMKGKGMLSEGAGGNSDIHSITSKLSSFTDMANSLKSTIDDVDAMK